MSDKEFSKWEERRKLGYLSFRRYLFFCFALGALGVIVVFAALAWFNVVSSNTLVTAVICSIILSPFSSWVCGPMFWNMQEMQYYETLSDREPATESLNPHSDSEE